MFDGTAAHHMIYGRYIDNFTCIMVSIGLCEIIYNKSGKYIKIELVSAAILIAFAFLLDIRLKTALDTTLAPVKVPGIKGIVLIFGFKGFLHTSLFVLCILICTFIAYFIFRKRMLFSQYLLTTIFCALFLYFGQLTVDAYLPNQWGNRKMDILINQSDHNINFLEFSGSGRNFKCKVQLAQIDKPIKTWNESELVELNGEIFFLINKSNALDVMNKLKTYGIKTTFYDTAGSVILLGAEKINK
jgi:hypothetical protein